MTEHAADYLIIGNSAAGVTAAEHIRHNDGAGRILVISQEEHRAYCRPLISYLLEGKTDEDHIAFKPPGFYEEQRIDTLLGPKYEAVKLDAGKHKVKLAGGDTIKYKKCLLATGSIPFLPPFEGGGQDENIFTFLSLDAAYAVRAKAQAASEKAHAKGGKSRALVVGAGLIGLKAAEAISRYVDQVVMLELAERILPAILDNAGAALVQGFIEKRGISCLPGITVERFVGDGRQVTGAQLTNGEAIECDLVIAAVGVRPNIEMAVEAGAESGWGLVCDESLQTSLKDVYAAGDIVQVTDVLDGSKHPMALWPNALEQGRVAGLHMSESLNALPFVGSFAVNAVDVFESSLLTAGLINPPADKEYEIKVFAEESRYAKFVVKGDRLMGYILFNRPANAGIYTEIIHQAIPLSSLSETLFEDVPLNLDFPSEERWKRLHESYPSVLDMLGFRED